MREHAVFLRREPKREIERREHPGKQEKRQDDGRYLYYKLFELKEQGFCNEKRARDLQRRQFEHEQRRVAFQKGRNPHADARAERVEQHHADARV